MKYLRCYAYISEKHGTKNLNPPFITELSYIQDVQSHIIKRLLINLVVCCFYCTGLMADEQMI